MKNVTLLTVYETLKSLQNPTEAQIQATEEIGAEIAKGAAKKQAAREAYEAAHDVVIGVMSDAPMTVAEIFAACEDKLPEDFSKNKVQYGLLNYWASEIVKVENPTGANGYRLA